MEKESGHYHYDPYPTVSKQNTNSLKRDTAKKKKEESSCCCFNKKARRRRICILLFGYTLIGSVIFLAIEGGSTYQHQILATTSLSPSLSSGTKGLLNTSAELKAKADEARAKTVENIWDITVSLNILYRDNWTRLAAQEITRFQNELLKSMAEEMASQQPVQVAKLGGKQVQPDNYEWTFAKAFLYSLTVLTTIVTMGYAMVGIPLTLLYLSSVGSILSRVARGVFSRALCCCLCSNCGYCCYDEKRMAEKEKRMKKKRQQMELQQQLAKDSSYRKIFLNNYNLGFHRPKKDQCRICVAFTKKDVKTEEYEQHINKKDIARNEKRKDKQQAGESEGRIVSINFDLQQVLITPSDPTNNQLFYKTRLSTYNFTVYNVVSKEGTCYMWHESEGGRGSFEIASCLFQYFQSLPDNAKEVRCFSDRCGGQNLNQFVVGMCIYAMNTLQLESIDLKFLTCGHSEMECHSMHSAISTAFKRVGKAYWPGDWKTIARGLQEPFYVRSNSSYSNSLHSPCRDAVASKEVDSFSGTDNDSKTSMHGWSILAPILLCLCTMFIYICFGTFVLYKMEG
nr:unnamed protein product [Callosobruchus analis]